MSWALKSPWKFLIILHLNLCFVGEVHGDSTVHTWAEETGAVYGPQFLAMRLHIMSDDATWTQNSEGPEMCGSSVRLKAITERWEDQRRTKSSDCLYPVLQDEVIIYCCCWPTMPLERNLGWKTGWGALCFGRPAPYKVRCVSQEVFLMNPDLCILPYVQKY